MWSFLWDVFNYIIAIFSFLLGVGTVLYALCSLIPLFIDSFKEAKEAIKDMKENKE